MTEYLVFHNEGSDPMSEQGELWRFVDEIKARSAAAALRDVLIPLDDAHGEFVAVPRRSFRPVTVKVETKTALKFS